MVEVVLIDTTTSKKLLYRIVVMDGYDLLNKDYIYPLHTLPKLPLLPYHRSKVFMK